MWRDEVLLKKNSKFAGILFGCHVVGGDLSKNYKY